MAARMERISFAAAVLGAAFGVFGGLCGPFASAMAAPDAPDAIARFVERATAYVDLRDAAARHVPPLEETAEPAEISAREQALADGIRAARPQARIGDVFGPAGPSLAAIVREDFASRARTERRALVAELPTAAAPAVNAAYPASLPLLTLPPALLDALPKIPRPLEYRLFGRHLILRDAEANLVVDVLPDVLRPAAS
jgi:hypothetical protein